MVTPGVIVSKSYRVAMRAAWSACRSAAPKSAVPLLTAMASKWATASAVTGLPGSASTSAAMRCRFSGPSCRKLSPASTASSSTWSSTPATSASKSASVSVPITAACRRIVWAVAGSLAIRRCRTSRAPAGTSVVAASAPSESSRRAVSLIRNGLPLDFTEAVISRPSLLIDADVSAGRLTLVTKPGVVAGTGEVAADGSYVKVRPHGDPEVPVILRIQVSGKVSGGHITARPPRRTSWPWLRRHPQPRGPASL